MMSEILKIIFFPQLINFHYSLAVLQMDKSDGFESIGTPIWKLAGCVFMVYCLLYLSLFKGVKSSGKVVWVTATGKKNNMPLKNRTSSCCFWYVSCVTSGGLN